MNVVKLDIFARCKKERNEVMSSIVDRNSGACLIIGDSREGSTMEKLSKAMSEMDLDANPADGEMMTAAGVVNNRLRVVSLFTTPEKADTFFEERITPAASKHNLMPESIIRLEVQNAIVLPSARNAQIAFLIAFQDASITLYNQVMDRLDLGTGLSEGSCAHIMGISPNDTTLYVLDLWESLDRAQSFYTMTLPPVLKDVGYSGTTQAPETWMVQYVAVGEGVLTS